MAGLRAKVVLSVDTAQAKRSTERAAAEMNRVMGGVGKRQVNFNVNSKSFTQPLGRITGSANEFTKSLEASNARVIAFGASVGIINAISDAFKNLVGETVRFEKTLTDINVVLNQSNSAMQQFGQGLFDVARNTAQSFNVASEAALEFSRQGLTMEEVLKRTNDALTLTRLTGLKAAEAVSGLTAAVNAFSSVGLTTTEVIDKLAAVDVKFAVSSEDLINALERTGAVAIDAGVELDSLIGLVTSLQQTTARGGAVIGNGLKTIFTRIQRPAALSQIEDLDIAVRNMSGAILPADKILINIAKSFDRLTSSQQSNIVQFSAGIFQANVFRASLRDLAKDQSIQARATEVSASAAGEAAMKNKQLNKTISALASQTGSDIQELATLLGELMVKPELGSYLETFRDVIGGIKNMLGGGEDEGSTFAKGLVAGIGNIITGPAFIAFGAIFIKLFMNIAKFAKGSMKDVMNIVDRKTKVEQIEKSIVDTLAKNKDIQTSLNNLEGDREAQSKFILKIIEAQTNAMREQEKLASRLARPLLDAGVKSDLTVSGNGRVDLDGDGRTDSFGAGGVVPQSARKERKEASRGGYSAGAVDSMSIKGLGRVVYNKAETVKQFPGMQQPAIMPPQKSRAGSKYKDAFSTKHGFDPYASGGFVPNFADLYNTGGQLADGGTGYFKTPLDLIERSLPRVGDLGGTEKYTTERRLRERQKQHLGAGRSREELLGEAHRFIYRYNTNDQVLDDLLTGDYTSLRGDVKFNKFLKSSSGISAGRLLAAGRPIARDLGYAYEVPTKGLDVGGYHPESQLRDSVGLENAEQTYPTTKFLSQLNFARDFFGGENEAQKKLLSKGFVPNFATLNGDALRLNQSKMHLYANPREAKPGGDAVRNAMKALVDSGKPVTVRAATDKLLKGEGGSHTKAIKGLIRYIADQKNGPKLFERDFKLTNLPWKGNKGEDASEDAVAQALNKGGNKYINTGKRPGAHGDKTFPVDLIGEGLDPVEVKSGEWQQPNILLKSMRLYSDDELMQFAERQYGATPEMLTGARMENLGKSARLLQGKGLLDKDASLEDQHNAALKYGIAGGFVPNFEEGTPTYKGKGARREALRLLEGVVKQAGGRSPEELEALPSIGELAKPEDNPLIFGGDSRKTLSEIINNSSHGRRASGTNVPITGAGDAFTRPLSEGGKEKRPQSYLDPQEIERLKVAISQTKIIYDEKKKIDDGAKLKLDGLKYETDLERAYPGAKLNSSGAIDFPGGIPGITNRPADASLNGHEKVDMVQKIARYVAGTDLRGLGQAISAAEQGGTIDLGPLAGEVLEVIKNNKAVEDIPLGATTGADQINTVKLPEEQRTVLEEAKDKGLFYRGDYIQKTISVASGLVPNFADDRNRQQKISDVLGDPSNAGINFKGGALKPRSIKSKNMFQKTWLESYFKTGLEGDYQMLMKMGYDPDQLLDLRAYSKKGGDVNVLGKGLVPNFAAGFGGVLAGASKTAVQFGLAKMPRKNDLFMGAANVPSKIAKVSSKKGELHTEEGQAVRLDQLVHQEYSNRIPGASNNLFSRTSSNPVGMFNTLNKSGKAMIRDGYLEGGLLKHAEGNGFRLQKMDGKWHYERMGAPTQADDRLMNDMEIMSGQSFNYGLQQSAPKSGGFIDWDSRRPGYLAGGLIPNFARKPNADFGSKVKSSQLDPARRMALEEPINVAAQNLLWKKGTPEDRKDLERLGYKGEKPWEFKWQDWNDKKSPIWEMLKMGSPQKGMPADNFKVLGAQFRYFQKQDQRMGVELNTPGDFFESYQSGRKFSELKHESANLNTRAADSVPAAFDRYRHRKEMAGVTDINGIPLPIPHGAQGMVPNFVRWLPNPDGGQPLPATDLDPIDGKPRSIYTGADVAEMKSKGYVHTDSKGWHFKGPPKGIGLAKTENNIKYMSGVAEPVSIGYLNSIKEFDRSKKNFLGWGQPGGDDRFSNLEELGSDMIKREVENALIIGYDSRQNMLQLIEGNHRLAAINEKNAYGEDNYDTLPAYVSGTNIKGGAYGDGADYSKGITNRKRYPSRLPAEVQTILEEQRERSGEMEARGLKPGLGMDRIIQGRWKPSEFGIPNFANPLKDAVSRERQAGIPESKIRVEKSNQLRGPGNPMGLAVTNTRDEPLGVGQGIRRARSMGIDPRKHGAASGVVPNFAAPDELKLPDEVFNALIESAEKLEKAMGEELTSAVGEAKEALKTMGNTGVTPSEDRKATEQAINNQSAKLKAEKGKDPVDQNKEAIKDGESIIEHLKSILGAIKEKEGAVGETAKVKNAGQKITKSDANIEQINTVINKIINKKIEEVGGTTDGKERKALVKTTEELQNFKKTLEESEESIKDEKQERGEGLQKLFYMQSAISMTNGFLEQFAEGARGGTAALIGVAQAASNVTAAYIQQKELIGEGMNMLGVGEKEKGFSLVGGDSWAEQRAKGAATELKIRGKAEAGGKKGGMLGDLIGNAGKLGRTFGRFLPIVGQLYTGFTLANEAVKFLTQAFPNFGAALGLEKGEGIMDLFSSSATKAAKKLERLGKTVESLETVLGHLENKEEEQIKLRELEVTGANRTQAQEKEYYDLRVKSIDTDAALAASMSSMMDETKSGSGALARINAVIGSTTMSMAEQRVGIRELIVANKMLIAATSQREGFQHGLDRASDGVNDSDKAIKLGEARGAQLALTLGSAFEGKADATDNEKVAALEHNIRELTKIRGNYKGIDRANFKTQDAIGSVGLQGMLSDQVVDIEDFESDMTWGLSDTEKKIFNAEVQTLIDGLKKRVKTQKSGLKDDVDMNILSRKRLKLALFNIEQEKKRAKHTSGINLENALHTTKSQGVENDILKEYEGISQSLQIRNKLILDGLDLQSKYQHDREEAERGAIDAIDKATQEKLTDPGSLMGPLNTSVGTHTKGEVQTALTEFDKRVDAPITLAQFDKAGETTTGITSDEKKAIRKSFVAAAREVKGMGDAYGKLQALAEEGNKLETARLKAIYVSLISAKEIIKQEDAGAQKNQEINEANDLKLLDIKNQNKLAKKDLAQASVGSLIAAKTVDGAKALHEKLIGNKDAQEISEQLAGVINAALHGEADTLAVINEYNEGRAKILLTGQALDKKAYQSQVEKNRTEMESGLLALRQLEYQNESLELSEESQMIQEIKLKTEIATAGQSAKEAELRYKFLSDLTNRSALIKEQIGAEMSGLRTAKMMNRDKLKQQIQGGELNEMVRIELEEQETSLSTEALKNAQLAANLSHLRESGSLMDMANRLTEKSNKLIEAQNASRQASISKGDLAFNTKAGLITEQSGAIGETRGAAMRAVMTNSPEDALAFASSLEETNKQLGNGSRAIDKLRSKMAELDVSAKNLGADLVGLGIDGVRSGFKQLLNDIGSGAKSAGDAWRDFGLGMAKTLLDRITDHNIDRIVKDLTFAFTGVDPMSEAEKIASSNNHLVTANDKLISALKELEAEVARDKKALDDKIGKTPSKDTPFDSIIPPATNPKDFNNAHALAYQASLQATASLLGSSPPNAVWVRTQGGFGAGGPPPAGSTPGATGGSASNPLLQGTPAAGNPFVIQAQQNALWPPTPAANVSTANPFTMDALQKEDSLKKQIALRRLDLNKARREATEAQAAIDSDYAHQGIDEVSFDLTEPKKRMQYNADIDSLKSSKGRLKKIDESIDLTETLPYQSKSQRELLEMGSTFGNYKKDLALLNEERDKEVKKIAELTQETKEFTEAEKRFRDTATNAPALLETLTKKIKSLNDELRRSENTRSLGKPSKPWSQPTMQQSSFTDPNKNQGGGIIQHFADGGFVKGPGGKDNVPAMLTAGEFVLPKKDVNNAFNFMGQNVRGRGDTIEGMRKNQSPSSQSQEVRDIRAAEGGRYVQKFNDGTPGEGAQEKKDTRGRLQRGVEGAVTFGAQAVTANLIGKALNKDVDTPPTFNMKKLENLDLGSDVNIKSGDPRASSRLLSKDPVMQEYRDYLMESASYKVQKTNENFRENMGIFSSIFQAVTSAVTAEYISIAAPFIQKGMTKAENYIKGDLGLGKHSDTYQNLKAAGADVDYKDMGKFENPHNAYKGIKDKNGNVYKNDAGLNPGLNLNNRGAENGGWTGGPQAAVPQHRKYWTGMPEGAPSKAVSWNATMDMTSEQLSQSSDHRFHSEKSDRFGNQKAFLEKVKRSREMPKPKTQPRQGGGSIPAMLTAGEGYIPAPIAKRIGYNNLSHMNNTGSMPIVKGTGGVDNVGPVGLNSGDFIMKKSSTNKLLRDNPNAMRFSLQGQSDGRKGAQGYYEGGVVGSELTVPARSLGPQKSQQGNRLGLLDQKESEKSDSSTAGSTTNAETTNNININISIDKAGAEVESEEGGEDSYEKERNLSMKIKGAVLEVIREEKRIGGELS